VAAAAGAETGDDNINTLPAALQWDWAELEARRARQRLPQTPQASR